MLKGLLIYNRNDYEKNSWFAQSFVDQAHLFKMDIKLVLTDEISLEIDRGDLYVKVKKSKVDKPDFVINRSRDSIIGKHFELMGCKVFNSSYVTEICNNKGKTHQIINSHNINSVKTLLCNKKRFSFNTIDLKFPFILKSVSGHGGDEVYKITDQDEINNKLLEIDEDEFILQEICSNPGKDIRVFVMGREIIGSVMRTSSSGFKSNISLGGNSEKYRLSESEEKLVGKITGLLELDFVGIDFILGENNLLFNEIEDVVGTRTLYKNYDIDVVGKYLAYIQGVFKCGS